MTNHVKMLGDLVLDEEFEDAAKLIRDASWSMSLSQEQLLKLYALYKQSTQFNQRGDRPGFFNQTARTKYDAWEALGDMPREQAMQNYIDLVQELSEKHGDPALAIADAEYLRHLDDDDYHHKACAADEKAGDRDHLGGAPTVSRMAGPDGDFEEPLKLTDGANVNEKLMYFATQGQMDKLRELLLHHGSVDPNWTDENKRTALHNASDRGHLVVVVLLIEHFGERLDLDAIDKDGSTPLHDALVCENFEIGRLLRIHGARTDIPNLEGETAQELAKGTELEDIISHQQ
eukprot:TRINITY_DN6714_c0_g1_i2.p1 TRINITY_DN6714_c0_g1~~TRINITY_DN6714_c0_g1_i2.p1  ORF type:complete len:289 (+),score=77.59 TRINITY_DN6714_c0_g1_i2:792-1658(+)